MEAAGGKLSGKRGCEKGGLGALSAGVCCLQAVSLRQRSPGAPAVVLQLRVLHLEPATHLHRSVCREDSRPLSPMGFTGALWFSSGEYNCLHFKSQLKALKDSEGETFADMFAVGYCCCYVDYSNAKHSSP